MFKTVNYNKLFWIVHTLGWFLFIALDFYIEIDYFSQVPVLYYWIISNILLYLILPILRLVYKKILNKINRYTIFVIKILLIAFLVGLFRKVMLYVVYIVLSLGNEPILTLLKNVYQAQISNFEFIPETIRLTIPVFSWSILYFGIKAWFDLMAEKEKSEKAYFLAREAELKLLRYQLNPHFLFNSLNSVQALIYENQHLADKMLTELSEFLRYSLDHKEKVFVEFKDEIEAIRKYLMIEKIRFEEKLEFNINSTTEADNCKILSFLLQPLIENAIKHGIKTTKIPLIINIDAKTTETDLVIHISNTGKWQDDNKNGSGIINVTNRLNNLYSNKYSFNISKHSGWVKVQLEIPKDEK